MPRELLSLGNDAVGNLIGVLGLFARPSSLRAVQPGRARFGSGFHAPDESADVDLFSAVRAVHAHKNKPNSCLCEPQFKVAHYRNRNRMPVDEERAATLQMKPRFLRRNWACPDCGKVFTEDQLSEPEFRKFFDCDRCGAHYTDDEFTRLNVEKWATTAET